MSNVDFTDWQPNPLVVTSATLVSNPVANQVIIPAPGVGHRVVLGRLLISNANNVGGEIVLAHTDATGTIFDILVPTMDTKEIDCASLPLNDNDGLKVNVVTTLMRITVLYGVQGA